MPVSRKMLRYFLREESGAIAVMFALMLPVIIGFIGLGVDVGLWYMERRAIQTAADAAAISAMYEKDGGGTSGEISTAASTDATRNGYDSSSDSITVNNPPTSGAYSGDSGYVEVIINRPLASFLSKIILDTPQRPRPARSPELQDRVWKPVFWHFRPVPKTPFT